MFQEKIEIIKAISYEMIPKTEGVFNELSFLFIEKNNELEFKYTEKESRDKGYWTFKEPRPTKEEVFKRYDSFLSRNKEISSLGKSLELLKIEKNYKALKALLERDVKNGK